MVTRDTDAVPPDILFTYDDDYNFFETLGATFDADGHEEEAGDSQYHNYNHYGNTKAVSHRPYGDDDMWVPTQCHPAPAPSQAMQWRTTSLPAESVAFVGQGNVKTEPDSDSPLSWPSQYQSSKDIKNEWTPTFTDMMDDRWTPITHLKPPPSCPKSTTEPPSESLMHSTTQSSPGTVSARGTFSPDVTPRPCPHDLQTRYMNVERAMRNGEMQVTRLTMCVYEMETESPPHALLQPAAPRVTRPTSNVYVWDMDTERPSDTLLPPPSLPAPPPWVTRRTVYVWDMDTDRAPSELLPPPPPLVTRVTVDVCALETDMRPGAWLPSPPSSAPPPPLPEYEYRGGMGWALTTPSFPPPPPPLLPENLWAGKKGWYAVPAGETQCHCRRTMDFPDVPPAPHDPPKLEPQSPLPISYPAAPPPQPPPSPLSALSTPPPPPRQLRNRLPPILVARLGELCTTLGCASTSHHTRHEIATYWLPAAVRSPDGTKYKLTMDQVMNYIGKNLRSKSEEERVFGMKRWREWVKRKQEAGVKLEGGSP